VRRDISRTLVVVAEQPQLWAAIRDRLDPSLALVRNARPTQLEEVWPRADPWPWLVVGAAREVPEALSTLVADRPIPVLWLRRPEGALPPCAVVHPSWNRLAGELDALSTTPVLGMSFAPRRGIRANGGPVVQAPELEGLMAAHPRGLPPFGGVQRLQRAIERHALPCLVQVTDEVVRLRAPAEPRRERRGPVRPASGGHRSPATMGSARVNESAFPRSPGVAHRPGEEGGFRKGGPAPPCSP
jgi:hypothetical protein